MHLVIDHISIDVSESGTRPSTEISTIATSQRTENANLGFADPTHAITGEWIFSDWGEVSEYIVMCRMAVYFFERNIVRNNASPFLN